MQGLTGVDKIAGLPLNAARIGYRVHRKHEKSARLQGVARLEGVVYAGREMKSSEINCPVRGVVQFEKLERTDLWMGERPMADAGVSGKAAVVSAHVMAGPWNPEMKSELFADIEEIVRDVAEMPKERGGTNLWMTFVEVPEGSWGVGGRPVSIEDLSPIFAEDRQQRIRNHLGAERSSREA